MHILGYVKVGIMKGSECLTVCLLSNFKQTVAGLILGRLAIPVVELYIFHSCLFTHVLTTFYIRCPKEGTSNASIATTSSSGYFRVVTSNCADAITPSPALLSIHELILSWQCLSSLPNIPISDHDLPV